MFLFIALLGTAVGFSQSIEKAEKQCFDLTQLDLYPAVLSVQNSLLSANYSNIGGKGGRGTDAGTGQYSSYGGVAINEIEIAPYFDSGCRKFIHQMPYNTLISFINNRQVSNNLYPETLAIFNIDYLVVPCVYSFSIQFSLPVETWKIGGGKSSDTGLIVNYSLQYDSHSRVENFFVTSEPNFYSIEPGYLSKNFGYEYS